MPSTLLEAPEAEQTRADDEFAFEDSRATAWHPDDLSHDQSPPDDDVPDDEDPGDDSVRWVTVATFSWPTQAHLARLMLESEGIDCFLADEFIVSTDWLLSNAVGGIKLKVPEPDAPRAGNLLGNSPAPRSDDDPGAGRKALARALLVILSVLGLVSAAVPRSGDGETNV